MWDRSEEYIPLVAESNIPNSIYSKKARECFRELLVGLLKRFRESTADLPIGSRIRLMNMTISAIAEMARSGRLSPFGEEIKSYIFPKPSPSESISPDGGVSA